MRRMLSVKSETTSTTKSEKWTEEQKDRLLGYLKDELAHDEKRKSQVRR